MLKIVNLYKLCTILLLGASLLAGLSFHRGALAATPSPSPISQAETPIESPTAEPTEINQKLKERLDRVIEEQSDKIMGVLDELSAQKRGLVGEVQRVSAESITIKTNKATHIIAIPQDVTPTKAGKAITIEDIAVGDWAIVVSYLKDDELTPEKIMISATSLRPLPQAVAVGSITEINRNRTQLTLQNRATAEEKTFVLTRNTKYQDMNGDALRATDITADLQALIVAEETSNGTEVGIVRLLVPPASE